MTETPEHKQKFAKLMDLLVQQKIISPAQAQLAQNDQQNTGMTLDEVLLARRWVKEETLYSLAPWLRDGTTDTAAALTTSSGKPSSNAANAGGYKDNQATAASSTGKGTAGAGTADTTKKDATTAKIEGPSRPAENKAETAASAATHDGKPDAAAASTTSTHHSTATEPGNFQDNLTKYYDLLNEILDDA